MPITTGNSGTGPITPDLQSIEDNVFTPICSKCHIGAGAPEGLQLDAAHAYNALVGVPSVEEPSILRVDPGNPDESYMVLKIEGASGIEGGQMPLGETPLPQATIAAIRQWITNGAPNVPATAAAEAFAVQDTVPGDKSTVIAPVPRIVVAFSREVDASLVNDTTLTLERMGDPDLDPGAAVAARGGAKVAIAAALAATNPSVLLISPKTALDSGVYRLSLRGTGGGALADLDARTLGADRSFVFTVEPAR
jgi:Bacterial Ig-like domain